MHIYFLNYHKFEGSSGIHIHFLANELVQLGIGCTVCVPHTPDSIGRCGIAHYDCITFSDLIKRAKQDPASFHREGVVFHAWTPREIVRRLTEKISHLLNVPYFIHLEDNEELLLKLILANHFTMLRICRGSGDAFFRNHSFILNITHAL